MNQYEYENYLMHYGVKGMKWGVRRAVRGHGGPGIYVGNNKKKLAGYKKDLKVLDDGGHLSVGFTKKRQAAYDKRDRTNLERKIAKTESKIVEKENMTPEQQKAARRKTALKVGAAAAGTALAAYGAYKTAQFIKNKNVDIQRDRGKAAADKFLADNKLISSTFGFGKDDSLLITAKTRSGNSFDFGEKITGEGYDEWNANLRKAQNRIHDAINATNERTEKNAALIRKSYVDRAKNDFFGAAAKNVANHYVEKAKDEINRRRR